MTQGTAKGETALPSSPNGTVGAFIPVYGEPVAERPTTDAERAVFDRRNRYFKSLLDADRYEEEFPS